MTRLEMINEMAKHPDKEFIDDMGNKFARRRNSLIYKRIDTLPHLDYSEFNSGVFDNSDIYEEVDWYGTDNT